MSVSLKNYNTFAIEAAAKDIFHFDSAEQLSKFFDTNLSQWYVVGGGSNILFTKDFDGVIICSDMKQIEMVDSDSSSVTLKVGSGVVWDELCSYAADNGYWGVENLSKIPGSVGASPVQNIGAYGVEACDVIEEVIYLDVHNSAVKRIKGSECKFGYRDSIFKHELKGKVVILEVIFTLSLIANPKLSYGALEERVTAKGEATIQNIRNAVIEIRDEKLPDPKEIGNGGSFFKNPVISAALYDELIILYPKMPSYKVEDRYKIPAAWLIDNASWKGYRDGDAGVHKNQALVLVNYGKASGKQIYELSSKIMEDIKERYGIELEREINVL
ncbi:MAG: UDP-N-acetylmuramate dehydrogenase [Rikenellaceae bacterium]